MRANSTHPSWRIPDSLWRRMEPLLPKYRRSRKGGRPRADLRQVADGIFYVLRTGCQWKAAPEEFGSGTAPWNDQTYFFTTQYIVEYDTSPVPEPTSLVLWSGLGASGLVTVRRRKRKTA